MRPRRWQVRLDVFQSTNQPKVESKLRLTGLIGQSRESEVRNFI